VEILQFDFYPPTEWTHFFPALIHQSFPPDGDSEPVMG